LALALMLITGAQAASAQTVATYHGSADRSGNFVMPSLTWERARTLRLDPDFAPRFAGHLYAQPLYWKPPDRAAGVLIVASESNTVAAIDAATGATLWSRSLGPSVPLSAFPCGNIDPLGITGTPVIDEAGGKLYLDAMVRDPAGPRHRLFALSLGDGSVLPGWPIDVGEALRAAGETFDSRVQNQRGALLLQGGNLYVPYGGFFGDCGDYHGWVVGVPLRDPGHLFAWRTRVRAGGIWAPGGVSSDGQSIYAATGNTIGTAEWRDGEAVLRLAPDLHHSDSPADYFAPADWRALDARDADLGGTNPLPLDLPRAEGGSQRVVLALGKDERAYVMDRADLGGVGGALLAQRVSTYPIRTAPAAFPSGDGVYVAFEGAAPNCTGWFSRSGVTVLRLRAGTPPTMETAWCGALSGAGSPIVTTTDGRANPIVWILGAEGGNQLHAFRGDNGERLFASPMLAGLRHFQTLIAADGRLFVGADDRLYAFSMAP
jgi:outer membrane protein assembly factor BamB